MIIICKYQMFIRGDDHVSNTPKQLMIYEAFGWEAPRLVICHSLLMKSVKIKQARWSNLLQFIEQYRDLGYLPEALFNFITLLGWSPEGERKSFLKKNL